MYDVDSTTYNYKNEALYTFKANIYIIYISILLYVWWNEFGISLLNVKFYILKV